jgi:nicotinate-nucleotide adenylyltransferase
MLEIAVAGVHGFAVDPVDLATDTPSYTSELLARIRERHPHDELWFIIGADSLTEFHTWHEPGRILSIARLAVAERPGWDIARAMSGSPVPGLADRVDPFSSVPVDLSATTIRDRLCTSEPVDWLVPASVLHYIRDHGLYEPAGDERA